MKTLGRFLRLLLRLLQILCQATFEQLKSVHCRVIQIS